MKNKLNQIQTRIGIQSKAGSNDETDMYMYGDIGDSWWGDSITDKQVLRTLSSIETDVVNLHINSNGGDTFQGIAICNMLEQSEKTIIAYVDGVAASAASIIIMGASKIMMPKNALIMIHYPWTYACGNAAELEKTVNALKSVEKSVIATYMNRFNGSEEELRTLLEGETYLTAEESLLCGLADGILDSEPTEEPVTKDSIMNKFRIAAQAGSNALPKRQDDPEEKNKSNSVNNFLKIFE